MAPKSPAGIEIYRGKTPKWRVGKQLGSGACAAVHVLEEIDGSPTEWAIKLAPSPKKKTKKSNSTEEVNVRLIHNESVMYQNQFQDVQGVFVPNFPPYDGPPATGDAEGYRYLILEKMESPLFDLVPHLLKSNKSSSMIDFGPIALQLLRCIQSIQDRKHVVVDIKPENFMLASGEGKGSGLVAKLASRIRILDLAMVRPWSSIGSHRGNDGAATLAGTPLYASLNVHAGETPSRRDDLEALGYLMSEIIMKLASGNASMELPWSDCKSDEDIGKMKASHVIETTNAFYARLGGSSVSKIMKDYFDKVRGYSFKQTPDYDELGRMLSKIKIPTPKTSAPRKKSNLPDLSQSSSSTSTRITRSRARARDPSDDEEPTPQKIARGGAYMETEILELVENSPCDVRPYAAMDSPDNASFATAPMDWEAMPDENKDPEPIPEHKSEPVIGVTIVVDSGPEKGSAINLVQGDCRCIVVGKKPTVTKNQTPLALSRDSAVDDSHIRLELSITKKLIGVVATDLKSSSGSFVGSEKIRSGKDWKLFRGDTVQVGNTRLLVKNLDAGKVAATPKRKTTAAPSAKPAANKMNGRPSVEDMRVETQDTGLARRGVKICVVQGPHRGEVYELEHGVNENFNVGSKPSGKGGKISLCKDKTLTPTHTRIELFNHKKLKAVVVTDKSEGKTKVNRDTISKGRAFINDEIKIGDTVLQIKAL